MGYIKLISNRFEEDIELLISAKDEASKVINNVSNELGTLENTYKELSSKSRNAWSTKELNTYKSNIKDTINTLKKSMSELSNIKGFDLSSKAQNAFSKFNMDAGAGGKYNDLLTNAGAKTSDSTLKSAYSDIQKIYNIMNNELNNAQKNIDKTSEKITDELIKSMQELESMIITRPFEELEKSVQESNAEIEKTLKNIESYQNRLNSGLGQGANSRSFKNSGATDVNAPDASRESNFSGLQKSLDKEQTAIGKLKSLWDNLTNATNKNTNANKNNANSVSGITNGWSKFTKSLTGSLVRFRIISSALKSMFSTIGAIYEKAASYEESLNLYTTSLGEYATQGRKWAEEISSALYLDETDVLQYTGALYNLVQGLGAGSKEAYLMSTNLTQLAYDMSSYLNIDVQSAYDKIQSAITGQSRAVASAGVALQQASLQELAYTLNIDKKVAKMTQAEKTYLRYIQIMRSTANMQGDLGKTIITPENALRTIRTQFTLLARAIGQVFIPIVLKTIPYVMALTQILTELAQKLAKWAGFELAPIKYDTKGISNAGKAFKGLDDSAKKSSKSVKNSVSRTLAAFDELNVVESKSKAGGASGLGGADANKDVLDDLAKYLDGYDMLKNLTDSFKNKVDDARKTLENLWGLAKKFIALWVAFKIGKGIIDLVMWYNKANTALGTLLGKEKFSLLGSLKNGFKALGSYIKGAFTGSGNVFSQATTTFGQFAAVGGTALAAIAAGFLSYNTTIKILRGETENTGKSILGLGAALTGLAVVGGVLAGPVGVIAALTTAVLGAAVAFHDYKVEVEDAKKYNNLFDGAGSSLENYRTQIQNTFQPLSDYYDKMHELNDEIDRNKESAEKAGKAAGQFAQDLYYNLENGVKPSKGEIEQLKQHYKDWNTSVIDLNNSEKQRELEQIERLYKEGKITKDEYNKMKKATNDFYKTLNSDQNQYSAKLSNLAVQLATGKITQEEYNQKVNELKGEYTLLNSELDGSTESMNAYAKVQANSINLEDPKALNKLLQEQAGYYDGLRKEADDTYDKLKTQYEGKMISIQKEMDALEAAGKTDSKRYKELETSMEDYNKKLDLARKQNEDDVTRINSTQADFLAHILSRIDEAGLTSSKKTKEVMSTIKTQFKELGDVDMSTSATKLYSDFETKLVSKGKTLSPSVTKTLSDAGVNVADTIINKANNQMSMFDPMMSVKNNLPSLVKSKKSDIETATTPIGKYINTGAAKGIDDNKTLIKDAVNNTFGKKYLEDKCLLPATESHSPSKMTQRIGKYLDQGLVKGINDNKKEISNSINTLGKNMKEEFEKYELKLKVNTSVESSFNKILTKVQNFCNKWRSAINDLMSKMKTSMNGIKVDKNNKITYTSMPKINVSKFDKGGYLDKLKSGDVFSMNEEGRAEFVATVGNRTAVYNQDQMITALTNAIVSGFQMYGGNNQGDTVVYIGNDKVYQGQGEYQNRQVDRYGTTRIIKV